MKTLLRAALLNSKASPARAVLFDGTSARAVTHIDAVGCMHTIIESGDWNFNSTTLVSADDLKIALSAARSQTWNADTLNGVRLAHSGDISAFDASFPTNGFIKIMDGNCSIIEQVAPAMSDDTDARYYLCGLMFAKNGDVVGCDGHRLHIANHAHSGMSDVILPRQAIDIALSRGLLNISIHESGKWARVAYKGGYIITPTIDGKFPDYQRVVPKDARVKRVGFGKAEIANLTAALRVAKSSKNIFAKIESDGSLRVGADITMPGFASFNDAPTGVNLAQLLDAMRAAGSGEIRLSDTRESLLIVKDNYKAVVMALRT